MGNVRIGAGLTLILLVYNFENGSPFSKVMPKARVACLFCLTATTESKLVIRFEYLVLQQINTATCCFHNSLSLETKWPKHLLQQWLLIIHPQKATQYTLTSTELMMGCEVSQHSTAIDNNDDNRRVLTRRLSSHNTCYYILHRSYAFRGIYKFMNGHTGSVEQTMTVR